MENFFTRRLPELDPASTLAPTDLVLVNQADTTRKATVAQMRATLATEANLNAHTGSTSNPHNTTAAQVGAFTTQQATAAITAAQTTVQNNLNAHTGNTTNPHSTTAAQVGAPTVAAFDAAVAGLAEDITEANGYTYGHIIDLDNPHNVTPSTVGFNNPIWNANRLLSRQVNVGDTPADGEILIYREATNTFELEANPSVSLDSPAFTGTPTAPTPAFADSSTKIATMQAVTNNATTGFFYAGRSAATSITTTTLTSLTTNWSVKHGAGAFSSGVWTCPATGWYHCDVYAKFDRTAGSTFTRAYADLVTSADVTIAPFFDFTPALNQTAQSRASALVYLTTATGYKMRVLVTHNGTTNLSDGSLSFRWAGLNGLGATA